MLLKNFAELKANTRQRTLSYEILLKSDLSQELLGQLLTIVSQSSEEVATFCLNRLSEYSQFDSKIR